MEVGLFLPVATRGFLISTTSPPFDPTFDGILKIVQRAEAADLDFCLSMVKLHGFGGPSRYWDSCLDPFTTIAAALARTQKIKLFASVPILAVPPAICARMSATIDSIAPGRFGLNIVTGWQKAEYDTMSMWPGESHSRRRYDYAAEYVAILKELWQTGSCTFDGEFFQMHECEVFPTPSSNIEIVCAGSSNEGMRFAAKLGDYNFIGLREINSPLSITETTDRLMAASEAMGRKVGAYALAMICADETAEIARARWIKYSEGADREAMAWASGQLANDLSAAAKGDNSSSADFKRATEIGMSGTAAGGELSNAISMGMGALIGSYSQVAQMLDELATVDCVSGVMVALADWHNDVDKFCKYVVPAMKSRAKGRAPQG